ncbi:hypothetical protein, partial [Pseudomonas oryzihabitans]|uniref:DUF4376 domain-containing protein n=1 Tax=Pseudomonas oryzihabitans TaxID=47885 RepID=UPI001DE715A2
WIGPGFPAYGSAWWPEEFAEDKPDFGYKWGAESYEVDADRKVVIVHREQVAMTQEELDAQRAEELTLMSPWIDSERDRRIASGFTFDGQAYQTESASDRENILGALGTSLAAITVDEAHPGDLRWFDPDFDFFWIAADDTRVPMDAHTCLAFARAAVSRKSLLVIAGNSIKQMNPIPQDYMDDKYWPAADSTTRARK